MKEFKYISNISRNEIESNIVIPCIDEEGNHTLLIKNSIDKSVSTKFSTDNLIVQIDTVLFLENREYYFHIIKSTKKDIFSIGQFETIYEYIFSKLDKPIDGIELNILITSIEDYFRTTPDKDTASIQIGVFGELLTIKFFYESGYQEIINKYHDNFYSKHDIEIDENNRIEIKTTTSEKRIHNFKHNQIYRNDIDVYVCSVMLEKAKEGVSLYDLFIEIMRLYKNPDSIFALRKLMKKCGVDNNNEGIIVALEKALNNIKIFNVKKIPKLEIEEPDGVTNIKYDVDCSFAESINIDDFVSFLESL